MTDRLTELFGGRVIALRQAVEWPPRSPDLTPLDFFLWGHLKAKVYVTPPANLEDLRRRITVRMEELRQDRGMVGRAVRNMLRRARLCVEREVDTWTIEELKHIWVTTQGDVISKLSSKLKQSK